VNAQQAQCLYCLTWYACSDRKDGARLADRLWLDRHAGAASIGNPAANSPVSQTGQPSIWELSPGNDLGSIDPGPDGVNDMRPDGTPKSQNADDVYHIDNSRVYVLGRGLANPNDPSSYAGPAQDVACYVTYVQLK